MRKTIEPILVYGLAEAHVVLQGGVYRVGESVPLPT